MSNEIAGIAPTLIGAHGPAITAEIKRFAPEQASETPIQPVVAGEKDAKPDRRQVEEAVAELRERMRLLRTNIQFSIDDDTQKTVVKVIDVEKKQVIIQLPPEYMLALAKFFAGDKGSGDKSARSLPQGLLIRDRA